MSPARRAGCLHALFSCVIARYPRPSGGQEIDAMPPSLALLIWFAALICLIRFDPANERSLSLSLWVPLTSFFILGSRNPSQWLGGQVGMSAQSFEEGNPLDRIISLSLILLAVGILMSRSFKWGDFFARNLALTSLLTYALVSVCWSDFPFIAFKRWFRDIGTYLMVLVILSDPRPLEAVRTVLRRLSYLLIPLSIVLNKYFPELSRVFDPWTGMGFYGGATTSKNMLGAVCMISGVFFFWDTVTRWPERKKRRTKRILCINAAFIAMTLWLLNSAASTTSTVCMALACLVIAVVHTRMFRRNPKFFKALIPACFCLYLILDFGLGMNGSMAQAVGKDPTLTDRTKIWAFVLTMHTNPIIGTGYQSFWLGSRLAYFWEHSGLGQLNESHNGYLETYLNLGLLGDLFLIGFLISSYREICRRMTAHSSIAVLGMGTWMALVFYNMSEAGFLGGLLYTTFLIATVAVPTRAKSQVRSAAPVERAAAAEYVTSPPMNMGSGGEKNGYTYRTS